MTGYTRRMTRVLTLNLWSYNNPHDYTVRRNTTRGAVPGSPAATQPAPGGSSWPIRRDLVLKLLREERPDAVGLQEVSTHPHIAVGRTAAHQLGDALGWRVLYAEGDGPPLASGVRNGLAILSPHLLRELARIPLPHRDQREAYLCLVGEVRTPAGPLAFLTTHFALADDVRDDRTHQEESVRRILACCRSLPPTLPIVLTGDLNADPGSRPVRYLVGDDTIAGERGQFRDAATVATGAPIATMASHAPTVMLDYVLVQGGTVLDCRTAGGPDSEGYYPSDHLGLVADLEFSTGRETR
ncbi:MAG: endonuclease/exonuclease/phosphatase family protein [Dehalococcoidia bacterium]